MAILRRRRRIAHRLMPEQRNPFLGPGRTTAEIAGFAATDTIDSRHHWRRRSTIGTTRRHEPRQRTEPGFTDPAGGHFAFASDTHGGHRLTLI